MSPASPTGELVSRVVEDADLGPRPRQADTPGPGEPVTHEDPRRAALTHAVELGDLTRGQRFDDAVLHRHGARRTRVHDELQGRRVERGAFVVRDLEDANEVRRDHEGASHAERGDETQPLARVEVRKDDRGCADGQRCHREAAGTRVICGARHDVHVVGSPAPEHDLPGGLPARPGPDPDGRAPHPWAGLWCPTYRRSATRAR